MGVLTPSEYQVALRTAIEKSVLRTFPARVLDPMLASSRRLDLPAKAYLRRPGDPQRLGLVVRGLARIAYLTDDGHELTIMWSHSGQLCDTLSLIGSDAELYAQAVTDVVCCDIDGALVRSILRTDVEAAWLALVILNDRLRRGLDELALFAYGDVRTRVKRSLLDIACRQPDETLIARVTQDELATGVAAARQSVARILGELRDAGVIRTRRAGIVIVKPKALLTGARHRAPLVA